MPVRFIRRPKPYPRAIALLLMFSLALTAACNVAPAVAPTAITSGTAAIITPAGLTLADAQQVAGDFLNAWTADRFDLMYQLLHVKSQGVTTQADFQSAYQDAATTMTLQPGGLHYRFTGAITQSDQAQLGYDVSFQTKLFGTFTDPARVLHLQATADGWRVAWSADDILAGMGSGAALYTRTTTPNRGNIYDRNGLVLADQNGRQIEVTLLTDKYPTGSPPACFSALASIFPARTADRLSQLYAQYTGRSQAYVIGVLSPAQFTADKATLEAVCHVQYQSLAAREYPQSGLAPHVVGYVGHIPADQVNAWAAKGYSPDAIIGLAGVEGAFESTLAGQGAATLVLRQNGQDLRTIANNPGQPAQSVYLTFDAALQGKVRDTLAEAFQSKSSYFATANGGAAIVMDVHTGEILALASYPDFNENALIPNSPLPNASAAASALLSNPRKPTLNRVTQGVYPLGSVFKIVTMAAAAESGQFAMNTLYTCNGVWNGSAIGDRFRTDWIYHQSPGSHGTITLQQALTGSCDIYFWHVGWTLNGVDPNIIPKIAGQMGFGAPTGIQGLAEAAGSVPDPATYPQTQGKNWTGSDALDLAIGQGTLLVTPLQVARMVAAVANDGTLYQPIIVRQIGLVGQPSAIAKPIPSAQLGFQPGVLAGIRQAMCSVTTNKTIGTATFVFTQFDFSKVAVCGKTGTAESGQLNPHAWFAAFAGKTAADPEIAVVAIVENSYEGSYVAAPIVRRIIENYYNLPITPWPAWYGATPETVANGGD